jgi:hypothetical protein
MDHRRPYTLPTPLSAADLPEYLKLEPHVLLTFPCGTRERRMFVAECEEGLIFRNEQGTASSVWFHEITDLDSAGFYVHSEGREESGFDPVVRIDYALPPVAGN